jgi:hypothetical protein
VTVEVAVEVVDLQPAAFVRPRRSGPVGRRVRPATPAARGERKHDRREECRDAGTHVRVIATACWKAVVAGSGVYRWGIVG